MIGAIVALALAAAPPDSSLIPGNPVVFAGHQSAVMTVAFAPDGKTLASGSFDRTVRVWDVATQKVVHTLTGPKDNVTTIAYSPDGTILAAGDAGLTVTLWSMPDGKLLRVMHNAEPIAHVVFSPDGKRLAAGGVTGTGEVFQVADGKELFEIRVRTPTYTKDGKLIAGVTHGGAFRLYDAAKGKEKKDVKGTTPTSSLLSGDGKLLFAYSGNDKEVIVVDAAKGERTGTIGGATQGISSLAISADGKLLAAASVDKQVRVYDAATKVEIGRVPIERTGFVAFSPDATRLVVGDGAVVKLFPVPKAP